jgi:hypothetical protein
MSPRVFALFACVPHATTTPLPAGMFGKKTTVDKIRHWKHDVIKTSLRKMPGKDLETQATQCFRNVTGYMGDRQTKKEDGT